MRAPYFKARYQANRNKHETKLTDTTRGPGVLLALSRDRLQSCLIFLTHSFEARRERGGDGGKESKTEDGDARNVSSTTRLNFYLTMSRDKQHSDQIQNEAGAIETQSK